MLGTYSSSCIVIGRAELKRPAQALLLPYHGWIPSLLMTLPVSSSLKPCTTSLINSPLTLASPAPNFAIASLPIPPRLVATNPGLIEKTLTPSGSSMRDQSSIIHHIQRCLATAMRYHARDKGFGPAFNYSARCDFGIVAARTGSQRGEVRSNEEEAWGRRGDEKGHEDVSEGLSGGYVERVSFIPDGAECRDGRIIAQKKVELTACGRSAMSPLTLLVWWAWSLPALLLLTACLQPLNAGPEWRGRIDKHCLTFMLQIMAMWKELGLRRSDHPNDGRGCSTQSIAS